MKKCAVFIRRAPFLTADVLRESMERLEQTGADGVVPVVAYSFPPQRCFVIEQDRVKYKWEETA